MISIIVPAFNEEKTLETNIKGFVTYLEKCRKEYELLIINDGSSDQTKAISEKICRENPHVKLISHPINKGKGAALRTGLLAGKGEHLLFLDADNATTIDHLDLAWPLMNDGCDIVIGSRNPLDIPGACQSRPQSIIKRKLGILGNLLIRKFTGTKIRDTQCGFKLLSRKALDSIIAKTRINRWALDVEILLLAERKNLKIGIIPVVWLCGPTSRVGVKGYIIALKELLQIKLNFLLGKYND